jgi:catechol 2,3-dioxygenase-like lactoylglutathione lyase family enzyme
VRARDQRRLTDEFSRRRIGAVELAGPNPPMFYFRDPDGNTLRIVQPG